MAILQCRISFVPGLLAHRRRAVGWEFAAGILQGSGRVVSTPQLDDDGEFRFDFKTPDIDQACLVLGSVEAQHQGRLVAVRLKEMPPNPAA